MFSGDGRCNNVFEQWGCANRSWAVGEGTVAGAVESTLEMCKMVEDDDGTLERRKQARLLRLAQLQVR